MSYELVERAHLGTPDQMRCRAIGRWALSVAVCAAASGGSALASSVEVSTAAKFFDTYGARFDVASTCSSDNNETVTGTLATVDVEACDTILADATITGAATFTAGDRVVLQNGFSVGSGASLTVAIDTSLYPDAYLQDDTPDGETVYAARFYVNPSGLTLGDTDRFQHFVARDGAGAPVLTLGIKYNAGLAEVRAFIEAVQDNGSVRSTEVELDELVLDDAYQWLEVGFTAGAGAGEAYLCVDSESTCATLDNLDNGTKAVESVRWGAMGVPSSQDLGSLDVDQFESQRALMIGPHAP